MEIEAFELKQILGRGDIVLVDVRLPEEYAAAHLPGAINHCVFETRFVTAIEGRITDPEAKICLYGSGPDSFESRIAAEKLVRNGFAAVYDFRGGVTEWQELGQAFEEGPTSPPPTVPDGVHPIDLAESHVEWLGRNLLNKHWGTIGLKRGHLETRDGMISGGDFVLDMAAIACADLAGSDLHDALIAHLASDDFFDVDRYPEARFLINQTHPIKEAKPGSPNLDLVGDLTLRGVTAPLGFRAIEGIAPDGRVVAQASLTFDRTDWFVVYGSGKFFRRLGAHLVNDLVEMQLRIITA